MENFSDSKHFKNINFTLHKGEILGFAGLVGAGRSEVMRALTAVEKRLSGDVYLKGKKVHLSNPTDALKHGIGFLTEDRRTDGCALKLDIKTNVNMSSYDMISKAGCLNLRKEKKRAEEFSRSVNVKTPSISQLVGNLSGGNQQKVVIALFLLATFLTKNFFGSYNLKNLTKQGAIVGVLAVAQTFIIITSGIDISGGAIAGLGCMTMAMIMNGKGTSMLGIAILANFVVCTLCGFLNGVIIFDLKVPAMIATLGTQTIFRGILKLLCNGNSISFFEPDGATFVKLFDTIGNYDIFGVLPVLACIWIVVAVIAFLVLRYTVFGRDLFVIGSGIEVARLSGIKVRKTFYLVYSLAGFVYGIAAIMFAGRILRAMPNTGDGYDMDAIAAAVIGGASLAGGRGAITGTFVGTLLMVVIKNAGKAFQINDYILDVITGALIIFAVAMDMVKSRKKA